MLNKINSTFIHATNPLSNQKTIEVLRNERAHMQSDANPATSSEILTYNDLPLDEYMRDLDNLSQMVNRKIQFSMSNENNKMVMRIIDKETQEVIREFPPEELRELHQKLKETAEMLGMIIDAKA